MLKEVTEKYSRELDGFIRELRKTLSHSEVAEDAERLLPVEDGSFCLVEKVAFQEPYRLVKLQNRAELRDYLMAKYDTSWGQDTTRPFIMENDSLMAE